MSKNYKEMRERLRLLLNKKKSKRRPPSGQSSNSSKLHPSVPLVTPTPKIAKKPSTPEKPPVIEKETRSLEDLLDFIEGTEIKCRNEKKAAKKARQKEKKQLLLEQLKKEEEEKARKLEEERIRKEREAAILEAAQNAQKAALKKKKAKSKSKEDSNDKMSYGNQTYQMSASSSGSQMVTIKRVMEPHESEPTVTITLRGATPKQDKVLYTLFNGQVCDSANSKCSNVSPASKKDPKTPAASSKKPSGKSNAPLTKAVESPSREHKKIGSEPNSSSSALQTKSTKDGGPSSRSSAVNNGPLPRNGYRDVSFDEIKLPPGITITKVDPANVKKQTSKGLNETKLKPADNGPKPSHKSSEVIVVSTNDKSTTKVNAVSNEFESDESRQSSFSGPTKKPKKKKETEASGETLHRRMPGSSVRRMSSLSVDSSQDESDKCGSSTKKKKKAKKLLNDLSVEEWNFLDNVFAPKDLDLDNGELDDAERELEAFKLFCMQSVPLQQKEKVNLNLKDLVLKKKSIPCN